MSWSPKVKSVLSCGIALNVFLAKETSDSGSGDSVDKEYIMIPVEVLEQYRSSKPKTVNRAEMHDDY